MFVLIYFLFAIVSLFLEVLRESTPIICVPVYASQILCIHVLKHAKWMAI